MGARWALIGMAVAAWATAALAAPPRIGPHSGQPVPRFESVVVKGAKGRQGPSAEHPVQWTYRRAGLPVEVIAEADAWRRVRDPSGDVVWMHASNLRADRTVFVIANIGLLPRPGAVAKPLAHLQPGVVARLEGCAGSWRQIRVRGRRGWVEAGQVWGAPDCPAEPRRGAAGA